MMILTASAMKVAERAAVEGGGSYLSLMENAGREAARRIAALTSVQGKKVLVLCGKGNNGGDGLVTARYLLAQGGRVSILFVQGRKLSPLSMANLDALYRKPARVYYLEETDRSDLSALIGEAEICIDAVFGTGFSGALPSAVAGIFSAVADREGLKVAFDVPSGVDCDSGAMDEASFRADYTYAFGALKPAHLLKASRERCGKVELLDIGIPQTLIEGIAGGITHLTDKEAAGLIPKRREDSNKGDYGKLLNIGGSARMTGAALLSSMAAMKSGLGYLKAACVPEVSALIRTKLPEAIHLPLKAAEAGNISAGEADKLLAATRWSTAVLFGCGLSVCAETKELTGRLIRGCERPMVIDADGLNCLSEDLSALREARAPLVLTPHMMEMSRLTGLHVDTIKARRFDVAAQFASEYGVTVVLKDSNTVIASPDGKLFLNSNGNSGMAKAGSGDVLAGLIASFLAQGASPLAAAAAGVYLHAAAGDLAARTLSPYSMLASDIIDMFPFAFRELV